MGRRRGQQKRGGIAGVGSDIELVAIEDAVAVAIQREPRSFARRDAGVGHLLPVEARQVAQLRVAQRRFCAAIALPSPAGGVQQIAARLSGDDALGDQITLGGAGLTDQGESGAGARDHEVEARPRDGGIGAVQGDLLADDRRERRIEGEDELLEVAALIVRERELSAA